MLYLWSIESIDLGWENAFKGETACSDRFRIACALARCQLSDIELLTLITVRGRGGLRPERRGFHRVETMKDITKIAVVAVLILALSPFAGFWIVALIGAGLLLLPAGAVISALLPKTWRHIEDSFFSRTPLFPAA